jgi:hypothetical protein
VTSTSKQETRANNEGNKAVNRFLFPKDVRQFSMWEDLIIGHLCQKSTALAREVMLKGQEKPAFKYEVFLVTSCIVSRPIDTDDATLMRNYDWQQVVLSDQDSYIRSLLSQTLPRGYLELLRVSFNEEALPVAWKRLESHYGQSNAQGTVTMMTDFDAALKMNFDSVGQLMVRVKETRNRINRQSRENLKGVTMIPNQLAAIKVLSLFPSQYWGNQVDYRSDGFHLDKVEALLRNVFMNKSRSQIEAMHAQPVPVNYTATNRPLGKCKGRAEEARPKIGGECFYCDGRYNRDGETHRKVDCPKMQKGRSQGLMRSNIFVTGTKIQLPGKSIGVAHVKGTKTGAKKKGKVRREEIPAEVALLQPISKLRIAATVKASTPEPGPSTSPTLTSEQEQCDGDELMRSSPTSPVPSADSSADDMDEHDPGFVPANAAKLMRASSKIEEASADIEETVRTLYPDLLQRDETDISRSDWVLDTGCGYSLTANASLFVSKQPSQEFRFTFGQGSKLRNTHVGSVQLHFLSPEGKRPFQFEKVAVVPNAKVNILSEFWLNHSGYQIVKSAKGGFILSYGNTSWPLLP